MGGDLSQGTVKGDTVACPVPRLALGRRRQVQAGALRQTHPPTGPHPRLADHGGQRSAAGVARPRRVDAGARTHPADHRGLRRGHLVAVAVEFDPHRGRTLPRDRRQQRRHGALLLHPPRLPDVLQERDRGPHGQSVHGVQAAARLHRRPRQALGRHLSPFGGNVFRTRLHDQLAAQRPGPRLHRGGGTDQLPLPGEPQLVRAAVGRGRARRCPACRRTRPKSLRRR